MSPDKNQIPPPREPSVEPSLWPRLWKTIGDELLEIAWLASTIGALSAAAVGFAVLLAAA